MPTMSEARTSMQAALAQVRDASFAGVRIATQNKRFNPNGLSEYLASTIEHQTGTRPALGTQVTRRSGIWFVQIFTELGTDMRRSDEIAQAVLDLLRNWPVGPIRIYEPQANEVGATDNAWFQVNVSATFEYDDFGA